MLKLKLTKKKIWWTVLILFSPIILLLLFFLLLIGFYYFNYLYIGSKLHIEFTSQVQFPDYEIINIPPKDFSLLNVLVKNVSRESVSFEAIIDSTQTKVFYQELDELIHSNRNNDTIQTGNIIWYDDLNGNYHFHHSPPEFHGKHMYIDINKKTGRMNFEYFLF